MNITELKKGMKFRFVVEPDVYYALENPEQSIMGTWSIKTFSATTDIEYIEDRQYFKIDFEEVA